MTKYLCLKSELKDLAVQIKLNRRAFRLAQSTKTDTWEQLCLLSKQKFNYRHMHIVKCLLRGRTRDQIERPRHDNKPDEAHILKLLEQFTEAETPSEKAVCASA